jgi:hypothetical protein
VRRWLVSLLVLVALTGGAAVRAQDDAGGRLSDEQRALIERMVQVHTKVREYQSYREESSGNEQRTVTAIFGGATRAFVTAVTWSQSIDLVRVDGEDNIWAEASAMVSTAGNVSYTVNAEARVIDGLLYVKAAFVPPAPKQIVLPDGWVIVEDPARSDVYTFLHLHDLINERASLYEDAALLETLVSDVALEARTLDDGTPVGAITLFFDRAGLVRSMQETANNEAAASSEAMYEAMNEDSYAKSVLVIGPDDTPVQFESVMVFQTAAVDAQLFGSGLFVDGTRLRIALESSATRAYSRINEPVEPASVPEKFVE